MLKHNCSTVQFDTPVFYRIFCCQAYWRVICLIYSLSLSLCVFPISLPHNNSKLKLAERASEICHPFKFRIRFRKINSGTTTTFLFFDKGSCSFSSLFGKSM